MIGQIFFAVSGQILKKLCSRLVTLVTPSETVLNLYERSISQNPSSTKTKQSIC